MAPRASQQPASVPAPASGGLWLGRAFVHPIFDLMVIGGGLSLVSVAILWPISRAKAIDSVDGYTQATIPILFLLSNSAHFAASTVRLYAKPGSFKALPFLTMMFPLATIAVTTITILFAGALGPHLNTLYLTWSPYHYSAQAYGLAMMYCYRSGVQLSGGQRRLLWWSCMSTFALTMIKEPAFGSGIWWVVPWSWASRQGAIVGAFPWVKGAISVLAFALPAALFGWMRARGKPGVPLIGFMAVLANASWFVIFPFLQALTWATVFHGLQYLAIVCVFHVKDRMAETGNRHGWAWHSAVFYGSCLGLGYALFGCWPAAYEALGFQYAASVSLTTAAINLHHFIVDGYIWKLKRDPNYKIVTDALPA